MIRNSTREQLRNGSFRKKELPGSVQLMPHIVWLFVVHEIHPFLHRSHRLIFTNSKPFPVSRYFVWHVLPIVSLAVSEFLPVGQIQVYEVFGALAVCGLYNPDDVGYKVTCPPMLLDTICALVLLRNANLVTSFWLSFITENVDDPFPICWREGLAQFAVNGGIDCVGRLKIRETSGGRRRGCRRRWR